MEYRAYCEFIQHVFDVPSIFYAFMKGYQNKVLLSSKYIIREVVMSVVRIKQSNIPGGQDGGCCFRK